MRILMLASEAVPLAKTGGLADVAGTLPVELARLGHEVQLALPRYASIDPQVSSLRQTATVAVPFRGDSVEVGIETGALGNKAGSLVCIRYDPFFSRAGLYGEEGRDYPDNLERFVLFCRAVLEACRQPTRPPGVLQMRKDRLFGVANGIDYDVWNPATDPHLPAHYSAKALSGKKACKTALQREMKLPARNVPLLGLVSRLAFQKGIDLIVEILPKLLELDVQMVVLGSGEPAYHERLTDLSTRYPGKLAVRLAFDEGLAHRIEAGADFFLMPSRYEPC